MQFLSRTSGRLAELDAAFHLTGTHNSAILVAWLLLGIREHYAPAEARLGAFLHTVGRLRIVRRLYAELLKQPDGAERAAAIYCSARSGYHAVTVVSLDRIIRCR